MLTVARYNVVPADSVPVTFTKVPGGTTIVLTYPDLAYESDYEEMTPNSSKNHKVWKAWEHYKRVTDIPTVMSDVNQNILYSLSTYKGKIPRLRGMLYKHYSSTWGAMGYPTIGLTQYYSKRADGGFVPEPANLNHLCQMALNQMMPLIKAELSILNSIIELKDFKKLPANIRQISSLGLKGFRTLRQLLRGGTDGYLQAQFNILPLLSDISGIATALSRTRARVNDLVARQGKLQTRHCVFWLRDEVPTTDVSPIIQMSNPTGAVLPGLTDISIRFKQFRYSYPQPAMFHAQVQYNYNYTEYQTVNAQLLGMMDALGLNVSPGVIWNAIPWSFVVDWVLGVSQWLKQYETKSLDPVINIRQFLWSVRRQRRILVTSKSESSNSVQPVFPEQPAVTIDETAYRRGLQMPTGSSLQASGLSSKEFSLGAALVLSRGLNRRNRK